MSSHMKTKGGVAKKGVKPFGGKKAMAKGDKAMAKGDKKAKMGRKH